MQINLDHSSFRPLSHSLQMARDHLEPAMVELGEAGVSIPIPLLWDLLYAPSRFPREHGARSDSIEDVQAWRQWIETAWIPLARLVECDSLQHPPTRLVKRLSQRIGAVGDRRRSTASSRALTGWSWLGGSELRAIIQSSGNDPDPIRLLGLSVMLESAGRIERADPFLVSEDRAGLSKDRRPRSTGRHPDLTTRGETLGAVGEFDRRRPSALPADLSRISPLELLLLEEVPDYFWMKVSENRVDQRFHRRPTQHDRRLAIELTIDVRDASDFHRFDSGGLPRINSIRRLVTEMIRKVGFIRSAWGLHVDLLAVHHPPLGGATRFVRVPMEGIAAAEQVNHGHEVQLARLLPTLVSHHPVFPRRTDGVTRRSPEEFDRRACILITSVDTERLDDVDCLIRCVPRSGAAFAVDSDGASLGTNLDVAKAAEAAVEAAIGVASGDSPVQTSAMSWDLA